MLRWRFSSGLVLGLLLGLPAGAILATLLAPPPEADPRRNLEIRELTRKLEAAQEARARADKQLEEFQKLADQMTRSFQTLERRFQELERQMAAEASVVATPTATPTIETVLPP